jgi:transposase-like protein
MYNYICINCHKKRQSEYKEKAENQVCAKCKRTMPGKDQMSLLQPLQQATGAVGAIVANEINRAA